MMMMIKDCHGPETTESDLPSPAIYTMLVFTFILAPWNQILWTCVIHAGLLFNGANGVVLCFIKSLYL